MKQIASSVSPVATTVCPSKVAESGWDMVQPYVPPKSSFDTSSNAGWGAVIPSSNQWAVKESKVSYSKRDMAQPYVPSKSSSCWEEAHIYRI